MPGRGSVSGHTTVVDTVAAAEAQDPQSLHDIRVASFQSGAPERIRFGTCDVATLAASLNTSLTHGLTSSEAQAKLEEFGPNLLAKTAVKSFWRILVEQVNVLNMLVVGAGVLCFVQGTFNLPGTDEPFGEEPDVQNGTILFVIVGLCMVVGAYMEWSCSKIMADVSAMSAPMCQVIRDGCQMSIDCANVVPGDIIVLALGDVIPADARVLEVTDLLTNEMPLTGEPYDITKTVEPEDPTAPFPSNILYGTTNCVNGGGKGIVIRTGMKTEMGKIAEHLKEEEVGLTSVQKTMNKIGRIVTLACLVLVGGIFCVSFFKRVNDPVDPCPSHGSKSTMCFFQKSVIRCLFNAVGAIPETLQPAAMFLLVVGCKQMVKVKAQTRKLAAVDTLGSCSYICSDKTGTLTEGKMTCMCLMPRVRNANTQDIFAFYPTRGFDPNGGIFEVSALTEDAKQKLDAKVRGETVSGLPVDYGDANTESQSAKLVQSIMMALYLNSYGTKLIDEGSGVYSIQGNMSEGALVVAAAKAGLKGTAHYDKYERDSNLEVPFSSARKMMATVHKIGAGGYFEALHLGSDVTHFAIIKGAPDMLLPWLKAMLHTEAKHYSISAQPIDDTDQAWFKDQNKELSSQALRVLAVALAPLTASDVKALTGAAKSDERMDIILGNCSPILLSLLGLMDPPRESAKCAVKECHRAGMRVAMITGDQKPTAIAIAKDLGIIGAWVGRDGADAVAVECSVLKGLEGNLAAIDDMTKQVVVWARAQPTDKVTIVESLQRQGHVVAMTGDGVNDAGALKKADIGVAMGIAGTDVAKGAADMVLMDDRFATIVDAVDEGRRIFANIQKMVAFLLCVNIFEVIVIMTAMVIGWATPLEDEQLFKANFVTHEFYPWCMVMEAAGFYNMLQPPRDRAKTLIPRLMRNVLMPFVFFTYCSLMLTSQAIGSMMYCETVYVNSIMGASTIAEFYDKDETSYTCIHAFSQVEEKNDEGEEELVWRKDKAPLVCNVTSLSITGGWTTVLEYGVGNKTEEDKAIDGEDFNSFTGVWETTFDIEHSFLAKGLTGDVERLFTGNWKDPHGWLVKCDVDDESGEGELHDDGKSLCWQMCGDDPCWQEYTDVAENHEDDDDPPEKPTLYPGFNAKAWGCRKMRSMILFSMVLMEFTMLYAFSKFEFGPPLVFSNMSFPIAWIPMIILLFTFVYFPCNVWDNKFAPLDILGLFICFCIAGTFYALFEGIKVINRKWFLEELKRKMMVAELSAEGKLRAYAGVREAFQQYPGRAPLLGAPMEVELQGARGAGAV